MENNKLKMYICVKDDISIGHAMTAVAHGSLMCHLAYNEDKEYKDWIYNSFKKVVCKINNSTLEELKKLDGVITVAESSLNNKEVAVVIKPSHNIPEILSKLQLYK